MSLKCTKIKKTKQKTTNQLVCIVSRLLTNLFPFSAVSDTWWTWWFSGGEGATGEGPGPAAAGAAAATSQGPICVCFHSHSCASGGGDCQEGDGAERCSCCGRSHRCATGIGWVVVPDRHPSHGVPPTQRSGGAAAQTADQPWPGCSYPVTYPQPCLHNYRTLPAKLHKSHPILCPFFLRCQLWGVCCAPGPASFAPVLAATGAQCCGHQRQHSGRQQHWESVQREEQLWQDSSHQQDLPATTPTSSTSTPTATTADTRFFSATSTTHLPSSCSPSPQLADWAQWRWGLQTFLPPWCTLVHRKCL